jgi:hypothetical protein
MLAERCLSTQCLLQQLLNWSSWDKDLNAQLGFHYQAVKRVLQMRGWGTPAACVEIDRFASVPMTAAAVTSPPRVDTSPSEDTQDHRDLETDVGFSHHPVLGELVYAYIVCHLDVTFAVTSFDPWFDAQLDAQVDAHLDDSCHANGIMMTNACTAVMCHGFWNPRVQTCPGTAWIRGGCHRTHTSCMFLIDMQPHDSGLVCMLASWCTSWGTMDCYLLSVLLAPFMCNGLLNPRVQSSTGAPLGFGECVTAHFSRVGSHLFVIDLCVTRDWYARACRAAKFDSDLCASVSRGKV